MSKKSDIHYVPKLRQDEQALVFDARVLKAVGTFASTDQNRYILNAVLAEYDAALGKLLLVATDGKTLAAVRCKATAVSNTERGNPTDMSVLIPVSAVKSLRASKAALCHELMRNKVSERWKLNRLEIEPPEAAAKFPKWRAVIPQEELAPGFPQLVNPAFLERGLKLAQGCGCNAFRLLTSRDAKAVIEKYESGDCVMVRFGSREREVDGMAVIMPLRDDGELMSAPDWALPAKPKSAA